MENYNYLKKAIEIAYKNKYFQISDKPEFGCIGIHCLTPNNAFYFDSQADFIANSAQEYIKTQNENSIILKITETIFDMISDELFNTEAKIYLIDIKKFCPSDIQKKLDNYIQTNN